MTSQITTTSNRFPFCRMRTAFVVGALLLATSFQALAQDMEPTTFWKSIQEKTIYERLWEFSRLYENESNSVIQAFSIIGRYNGQYWSVNADQGSAQDWENRRFFLGAETVLFHDFIVQALLVPGTAPNLQTAT